LAEAPRILFVPVSGVFGMGEYARSLSIAQAARRQWPQAHIHFILSRQAPYAATAPFPATLLDSSPTFHTAAVAESIQAFRPNIVIFDNAGRTAQLRAGYRAGARIVFISSRSRQRRKAFRWRWMRLIDEHWIAYPQFIAGGLGFFERFKLNRLKKPVVRYLDVILSRARAGGDSILAREGLKLDGYVLVVPGGGTGHPGAGDASAKFLAAAHSLADSGLTVFVGPGAPDKGTADAGPLRGFNALPQADLAALMGGARLVITNGGSTLLQAIACGRACIGVPIAQDQPQRIQRCVEAGVARAAKLDAMSMVQAAGELLRDESARAALARRASDLQLADGIDVALAALIQLMKTV
jgi:spore coat polysaccharide biosynthesis predicted glycosyltransferase SpsG